MEIESAKDCGTLQVVSTGEGLVCVYAFVCVCVCVCVCVLARARAFVRACVYTTASSLYGRGGVLPPFPLPALKDYIIRQGPSESTGSRSEDAYPRARVRG